MVYLTLLRVQNRSNITKESLKSKELLFLTEWNSILQNGIYPEITNQPELRFGNDIVDYLNTNQVEYSIERSGYLEYRLQPTENLVVNFGYDPCSIVRGYLTHPIL